jgi:hypothetical protein
LVALIAENGPSIMAGTIGAGPYVVAITTLIKWNGAPPDGVWKDTLRSIVGVKPAPTGIIDLGQRSAAEHQAKLDAEAKTLAAGQGVKQVQAATLGSERDPANPNVPKPFLVPIVPNTPLSQEPVPEPIDPADLNAPHSDEPV